jgi:hypothetical protein
MAGKGKKTAQVRSRTFVDLNGASKKTSVKNMADPKQIMADLS